MKNDTNKAIAELAREEIFKIIIRNFLESNFNTITLALNPQEVYILEEIYGELITLKEQEYNPQNELCVFTVSKIPHSST